MWGLGVVSRKVIATLITASVWVGWRMRYGSVECLSGSVIRISICIVLVIRRGRNGLLRSRLVGRGVRIVGLRIQWVLMVDLRYGSRALVGGIGRLLVMTLMSKGARSG